MSEPAGTSADEWPADRQFRTVEWRSAKWEVRFSITSEMPSKMNPSTAKNVPPNTSRLPLMTGSLMPLMKAGALRVPSPTQEPSLISYGPPRTSTTSPAANGDGIDFRGLSGVPFGLAKSVAFSFWLLT